MALTEEQLQEIHEAQQTALQGINSPKEIIYPIQQNIEIARDVLITQRTPIHLWNNVSIWVSAYMAAKADGLLIQRPTIEQLNARREANDRRDGSRMAQRHSERATLNDPLKEIDRVLSKLFKQGESIASESAPAQSEAIDWPAITADYEQLSPEDQAKFRKLSSENMKIWLKRRAEARHRERFGDTSGVSVRSDNHIS